MRVAIGPSSFAEQDKTPLELLVSSHIEVIPNPYGRRLNLEETIKHLTDVDGLIAGLEPLGREVLESSPRLKVIARVGIGMDNIDLEAAAELGIKVSNTPEGPTDAVAEMCLTALLAVKRKLLAFNADLHEGTWKKRIGNGLRDCVVMLIGYGRIGQRFGEHLRYFGAKLLVCDQNITQAGLSRGERLVSLDEGLPLADVVSLHADGSDVILGKTEFEKLKPGAILLNSARGVLVDEDALVGALENNAIAGAWLDVYREEPYNGPLVSFGQVMLTPHVSTYTVQCRRSMEESAVLNLLRDLDIS